MIYANIAVLSGFGILFALFGNNTQSRLLGLTFVVLGAWNAYSLL